MKYVFFALISFFSSVIGCICGIGGGVIIKPVADAFGIFSVSTASFMSGCIVLSMTTYSIGKAKAAGELRLEKGISAYIVIGATVGGVVGKELFSIIKAGASNPEFVGEVQSAVLLLLTVATILYTVEKEKIRSLHVTSPAACILIGLMTGLLSAFLGIGGGPINLVVLFYFFSMDAKTAAQNSLYIIMVSQIASLIASFVTRSIPEFPAVLLVVSIACGVLGGMVGRKINKRIDNRMVEKLFLGLLCVIVAVCGFNIYRFSV